MTNPSDLIGQRFSRLVVLSRAQNGCGSKTRFNCLCDCGTQSVVYSSALLRGLTKSCGCWRVEMPSRVFKTHGMRRTAEYRAWCHMKTRCLNPKSRFYHRYGGRGITICQEWIDSFEVFYRDMGPRPSPRHSVERKKGEEGYNPANCCWALPGAQAANRSTVRFIEFNGITDTMAGWSRRSGVSYLKFRRRIMDGWPIERALEAKDCAVRALLFKDDSAEKKAA